MLSVFYTPGIWFFLHRYIHSFVFHHLSLYCPMQDFYREVPRFRLRGNCSEADSLDECKRIASSLRYWFAACLFLHLCA